MSNENRNARIALARIYGSGCMFKKSGAEKYIEKLGTIKTYKRYKEERHYTSQKLKSLENLLTFHHMIHKANRRETNSRKWCHFKCFSTSVYTQFA